MSAPQKQSSGSRPSYVLAVCALLVVGVISWQAVTGGRGWKRLTGGSSQSAKGGHPTLAWKQPILPAQFEQGSCGACHKDDLDETPRLTHGRQLLVRYNCVGCHELQDIDHPAMLGPDLSSVGTKVSREWIYKWLKEPRTVADADGNVVANGVSTNPRMPKFQLSDLELRALSAYLSVQHAKKVTPYKISSAVASQVSRAGDAAEQGHTRFNQMFCVTCHSIAVDRGGETKLIGGDIGPELTKVGSKVKQEWLIAWLKDPQEYLQHTRMPQYQWSDKDLYAVTQYLLKSLTDPGLLKDVPQLGPPTDGEVHLGAQLFKTKGCVQCHVMHGVTPQSDFGPNLTALGMAAGPYLVEVSSPRKLTVPLHFAKSPVGRLDIHESVVPRSMIAYLQAKITKPASVTPETHMPQFHMSQSDLDDVTTALLSMSGPPIPVEQKTALIVPRKVAYSIPDGPAGQLYQRFKCYVCHTFRGYGGTLAPDLSFEGSRSKREWLVDFLKNPQTLRPILTVRMPHFNMSDQDATTLANYLSATMKNPGVDSTVNNQEFTPQMAALGKRLYENKYACQSCHTIGSSGGYVGPSLNNAGNWLTPAWIESWLRDPQKLVHGAIEPKRAFGEDEIKDITAYLLTLKQAAAAENSSSTVASGGKR